MSIKKEEKSVDGVNDGLLKKDPDDVLLQKIEVIKGMEPSSDECYYAIKALLEENPSRKSDILDVMKDFEDDNVIGNISGLKYARLIEKDDMLNIVKDREGDDSALSCISGLFKGNTDILDKKFLIEGNDILDVIKSRLPANEKGELSEGMLDGIEKLLGDQELLDKIPQFGDDLFSILEKHLHGELLKENRYGRFDNIHEALDTNNQEVEEVSIVDSLSEQDRNKLSAAFFPKLFKKEGAEGGKSFVEKVSSGDRAAKTPQEIIADGKKGSTLEGILGRSNEGESKER